LPPLLYRKADGLLTEATPRNLAGFPLGVADGIPYDACTVSLQPGDCLVLFTDGITDAKDKQETEFQMEGVRAALTSGPCTPRAMGERLIKAVKQHALGCKQHDDITLVCFGRTTGNPKSAGRGQGSERISETPTV
jgi:serine phosphatase RsbU (regulator of sigma subunit)